MFMVIKMSLTPVMARDVGKWAKMPVLILGQIGQTSEEDNWKDHPRVCVCVLFVRSWNGFGGAYGRRGCRHVGWSWEIQQISDKTKTIIDDASSVSAQKKEKQMKQRGEGRTGGRKDSERQRETKNEKWTKTTEPISPSNKHSSWTSFSDRQQWKGGGKNKGSSGNKELIKIVKKWSCQIDPRKREKQNSCTSLHRNKDETKGYWEGFRRK